MQTVTASTPRWLGLLALGLTGTLIRLPAARAFHRTEHDTGNQFLGGGDVTATFGLWRSGNGCCRFQCSDVSIYGDFDIQIIDSKELCKRVCKFLSMQFHLNCNCNAYVSKFFTFRC